MAWQDAFFTTLKSYFDVATVVLLIGLYPIHAPPSLPPPPPRSPPALPPLPPQGPPLPTSPPFNPPQPPCSPPRHPTPLAGSPAMPSETSATGGGAGISAIINQDDPADVGEVIGQDDDDSEALLLGGDELQPYVLALSIGAPIALVALLVALIVWRKHKRSRASVAKDTTHDMIPSPAPPRLLPPNPVHVDAVHRGSALPPPQRLPMPQFPSPSIRHAELTRSDSLESGISAEESAPIFLALSPMEAISLQRACASAPSLPPELSQKLHHAASASFVSLHRAGSSIVSVDSMFPANEPSMAEVRLQADPQLAQIEEHFAFVNTILKGNAASGEGSSSRPSQSCRHRVRSMIANRRENSSGPPRQ